MIDLRIDVEEQKELLTNIFRDQLEARGALSQVENVDILDVAFRELTDDQLPGKDALLDDLRGDLKKAVRDAEQFSADVQPHLTAIPQSVINYATVWDETIPLVLAELRKSSPDRCELRSLFGGLVSKIDKQETSLQSLLEQVQELVAKAQVNADNFSQRHEPFRKVEKIDKENLAKAKKTLAAIQRLIAELDTRIDRDVIAADRDLAIATAAMKYGKKGGKAGKIIGLTLGLIFIISATMAIDDLMAAVQERLDEAEESGEYELEITTLNQQLIGLDTASGALARMVTELDDLATSIQSILAMWAKEKGALGQVVDGLADDGPPPGELINLFQLGETQAEWKELGSFSTKWQTLEIGHAKRESILLDGFTD